jgi:chromosome partitioning protein
MCLEQGAALLARVTVKIIAIAIQKGGAGKTTTALNLAAGLRDAGRRCLLIDLDPQASLSHSLGVTDEPEPNIYHLLKQEAFGKPAAPQDAIRQRCGLDLIPACLELAGAELELVSVWGREHILSQILARLQQPYDFVIIDCPPSIGMLTVNALVASEFLLMPVLAEFLSLKGAQSFLHHLETIRRLNSRLKLLGFVLTRYDGRKTMTGEVKARLEQDCGGASVFEANIRNSIALAKAQQSGVDIFSFDKQSNGAKDYSSLTREFLTRVGEA